jgi:hypothetical protein
MRSASKRIILLLGLALSGTGFLFAQNGYGTTFAADVAFPTASFGESFKTGFGGHVDFYMESSSTCAFRSWAGTRPGGWTRNR